MALDNGFTNTIEDRGDHVRKYIEDSRVVWGQELYDAIHDREFGRISKEDRLQREQEATEYLEEAGIPHPEVLEAGQDETGRYYLDIEKIEGQDLQEYADDADPDALYEIAKDAGEILADLHEHGNGHRDPRLVNFVREDGTGRTYLIDHEFFQYDIGEHDRAKDLEQLTLDARMFEPERYQAFRDGLEDGYGEVLGPLSDASSGLKGLVLARTEPRKAWNCAHNTATDLYRAVRQN